MVVHTCVDGYSRLITSLGVATNNKADTALSFFLDGISRHGVPLRVRGDNGTENNGIECFMRETHGKESAYIRGPSVHNQRVERLHYDTTHCALSHYIDLFLFMEDENLLDRQNKLDVFCLQMVYKQRIQDSLDRFRDGWNNHSIRTEKNKNPLQLWTLGTIANEGKGFSEIDTLLDPNHELYGVDFEMDHCDADNENPTVPVEDISFGEKHAEFVSSLSDSIDLYENDGNHGIDTYIKVKDFANNFWATAAP